MHTYYAYIHTYKLHTCISTDMFTHYIVHTSYIHIYYIHTYMHITYIHTYIQTNYVHERAFRKA